MSIISNGPMYFGDGFLLLPALSDKLFVGSMTRFPRLNECCLLYLLTCSACRSFEAVMGSFVISSAPLILSKNLRVVPVGVSDPPESNKSETASGC